MLRRRKIICFIFGVSLAILLAQRYFASRAAFDEAERQRDEAERQRQQMAAMIHAGNEMRAQALQDGTLWEGPMLGRENSLAEQHNNSLLVGQRWITLHGVSLASGEPIVGSLLLHECRPGSLNCASGGTLTVSDATGPVFECSLQLLSSAQGDRASYYSLQWLRSHAELSDAKKRAFLESLLNAHPPETRIDIRDSLRRAYGYAEPIGDKLSDGRDLIRSILRVIIDDRA